MALLFADEDFREQIVVALRAFGHDVLTVRDLRLANRGTADPRVLAVATSLVRVLLTHNRRHYVRLHRSGAAHAGIVAVTQGPDDLLMAGLIHELLQREPDLGGRMFRVCRPPAGTFEDSP